MIITLVLDMLMTKKIIITCSVFMCPPFVHIFIANIREEAEARSQSKLHYVFHHEL